HDPNMTPYKKTYTATGGSIHAKATAITGYMYVHPGARRLKVEPGRGYLTLWPGGTTYPLANPNEGIASLVFIRDTTAGTSFTVSLSSSGQFHAAANYDTHLVIEVTGY